MGAILTKCLLVWQVTHILVTARVKHVFSNRKFADLVSVLFSLHYMCRAQVRDQFQYLLLLNLQLRMLL